MKMNYLIKIKEFFRFQVKIQSEFEVREKISEEIEIKKDLDLADLNTQKKIVTPEQKAHMLKAQVQKELYRNQMQRFT